VSAAGRAETVAECAPLSARALSVTGHPPLSARALSVTGHPPLSPRALSVTVWPPPAWAPSGQAKRGRHGAREAAGANTIDTPEPVLLGSVG